MNKCMFFCGFLVLSSCSYSRVGTQNETSSTEESAPPTAASAYDFKLKSIVSDKNYKAMGKFHFRHNQSKPINIYGFGFVDVNGNLTDFDSANVFRVRHAHYKVKDMGIWIDVFTFECGTGSKEYPIQPHQDYTFLIPLTPFIEGINRGDYGIVGVVGTGIQIESQPFETAGIQDADKWWIFWK